MIRRISLPANRSVLGDDLPFKPSVLARHEKHQVARNVLAPLGNLHQKSCHRPPTTDRERRKFESGTPSRSGDVFARVECAGGYQWHWFLVFRPELVMSLKRSRPERTMRLDKSFRVKDAVRVTIVRVRTGESIPHIPSVSTTHQHVGRGGVDEVSFCAVCT